MASVSSSNAHPRRQLTNTLLNHEDLEELQPWSIDNCSICEMKDTTTHAFLQCPRVHALWTQAISLIPQLINDVEIEPRLLDINLRNVILGFPELMDSLPKLRKERVLLWHSAVIFTITTIRTEVIWKGREYGIRTNFKWGDPESRNWFPISKVKYELCLLLWEAFRQAVKTAKNLQRASIIRKFELQWCENNNMCSVQYRPDNSHTLSFHL
jgi:hypothetical protein